MFVKNQAGKEIALINGYTYYNYYAGKTTSTWRCTRGGGHCNAFFRINPAHKITSLLLLQIVTNPSGKQLALCDGHTYYLASQSNATVSWRCTKGKSCKARMLTTKKLHIIRCNFIHCHPKSTYIIRKGVFLKNAAGNPVAVLNGYTFYPDGRSNMTERWRCSTKRSCKARFTVAKDDQIVLRIRDEHDHEKPFLFIDSGIVFR
ncbi:unnamed protein product [Leptidea sinapis]|uniref:FLYWCH-type domain-containing protein n=1 Tax=Leptidea sinapis TaxID=189913 RepID=A0A5E4PXA3_9NEOP|nr:unnamed protein product [Leptidea sinapis]